jgi:hypothetical protein
VSKPIRSKNAVPTISRTGKSLSIRTYFLKENKFQQMNSQATKYQVASMKQRIRKVNIKAISAYDDFDDFDGLLVTIYTSRLPKFYHQGNFSRLGFIKL